MAITTYNELQQAVIDWVNNPEITQSVTTFITLAEAKLNRELRTRDMLIRAEAITTNEFVVVPSDFLENYSLELNMSNIGPQQALAFIGPLEAKVLKANKINGLARYYTMIDGAFEILPAPATNTDIILTYYQKIPALSGSQTTNWLLTKSPDLYLYSTLLEAAPYLKDTVNMQVWMAARQQIIDAVMLESERAMRPSTQLVARKRGFS
jgi:hypothetical protein